MARRKNGGGIRRVISEYGHQRRGGTGRIGAIKRAVSSTRRNPTKAERAVKAQKAAVQRRVAVALAKFLKQANPAMKTAGAEVQRLKGGVIKITPIKANAAHWQGWMIPGVNAGFKTKAAAQRHIREHGMTGVKPVRVKKPSDQLPIRGRL